MNINNLQIGDLIVRQKGPFSTHYMVYTGVHDGQYLVAENQTGVGVRFITLNTALAGNSIKRFEKFGGTESQRSLVLPRIHQMLGKKYDLVVFNCEHFARWIANGKIESKQVKVASTAALIGGAAMLTSKNPVLRTLGVASVLFGVIGHVTQRS